MYEPVAVTRVGRAEGEMCAVLQSQGSLMDGEVLESYFFRLTQVAYISISVCCTSDFENENGVKIENGMRPLGNKSRSSLGKIHRNCVRQEAQIEQKSLSSLGFTII